MQYANTSIFKRANKAGNFFSEITILEHEYLSEYLKRIYRHNNPYNIDSSYEMQLAAF